MTPEVFKAALELELPYSERPPTREGKAASVLALLGLSRQTGEYSLLLTRRTESVDTHKGQMAFPGGAADPGDRDSSQTALRETAEEVGIQSKDIELLGQLPGLWTVTGFWISPWVGLLKRPLEEVDLVPNPSEIAEIFWIPLKQLLDPAVYSLEFRRYEAVNYPIHVFNVGVRIWGATGSMVKNFLDRIRSLG